MGRARNPKRDKAFELWSKSDSKRKLADIATELDVPESRIRKWKSEDKWESKIRERCKKERSEKTLRNKGAPKGNKNACGHGAPQENTNALKHGGYSSIYWNTLSDEERKMLEKEQLDEETQLIRQIDLCTIREIRLMKALNKYEEIEFNQSGSGLAVNSVSTIQNKRVFSDDEKGKSEKARFEKLKEQKIEDGKISYLGQEQNVQTHTEATYNIIVRLQAELTRVQKQKTQCIIELAQLHERKTNSDRDNNIANDWIAGVEEAWKDDE